MGLRARTIPDATPPGVPPAAAGRITVFHSRRRRLTGLGEALRIHLPAPWVDHLHLVTAALGSIEVEDEVGEAGCGPVAFGALPFDRTTTATLLVPRTIRGEGPEGTRWLTTIEGGNDLGSGDTEIPGGAGAPFEVATGRSPERWCETVEDATKRIRDGQLEKVVLARELIVSAAGSFRARDIVERLIAAHPAAYCFSVDDFVGASPELLVSRIGGTVRAQPMAGTTPRSGDPDRDQRAASALASDPKNTHEHRITIDMVHDTLLPWCSYLDIEPTPSVVPAGAVQHLATLVEGRLSRPEPSVLELVAALHPTPAVGGSPRDVAVSLLTELEGTDRGRYAGPTGWVDAHGNGAFCVSVRSAQLEGSTARLFAGVGVVADSDPAAELAETRAKAQALLGALIRP